MHKRIITLTDKARYTGTNTKTHPDYQMGFYNTVLL
jgi:hypothetical protein